MRESRQTVSIRPFTLIDDEAFRIWNEEIGIPKERIYRFGKEDNFWEHGVEGPWPGALRFTMTAKKIWRAGGQSMGSEGDIHEVWNVVFSQFNNDGHEITPI